MTQSFYTAISGMNAAQTKLNVVSDNIANMNTVGFKQSDVQFSDIYYNTISPGGAPSKNLGGTNAKQIGTGVRTAAIARDFTGGSAVTTGISTHLSIKGNGFFTVASANNEILYTKAGNFTVDAEGHLQLPNGFKVLGTSSQLSTYGSSTPIKIPTLIQTSTEPSPTTGATALQDLNGNVNFTAGDFSITVNGATTTVNVSLTDTVNDVINNINTALGAAAASLIDGAIVINDISTAVPSDMVINNGTSNFATESGLTRNDTTVAFESKTLAYHQTINAGTDINSSVVANNVDIYENGIIEVTYANGDKLSVTPDPNNPQSIIFQYKTGNPAITLTGSDITIPAGVCEPANLQIQMANFINPNGLVAVGSNAYREGANSGMATYGSVTSGAYGALTAGEYEGSNVDLTEQFTQMILAQRMIEANGRVFDTASSVLKTLTYLGQ